MATKWATTWLHIDTGGVGTSVDNVAGTKYWVVCGPKNKDNGTLGDPTSMKAFGPQWDTKTANKENLRHEAVVLKPGTML